MTKIGVVLLGLLLPLSGLAMGQPVRQVEGRPNVIVIFTDDQGYADLSCMGIESDVKTPHIDRLAEEGLQQGSNVENRII
tara:strand:- start:78 stop:317 length:240 start_codon:yes stop_codon:yes gene_type:complete